MAGIKISNDLGASVFAILSGLSALFLTAWIFGTGGCGDTSSARIDPIPAPVAGESSASQQILAEAREALAEESARRAELANDLRSSKATLGSLAEENNDLKARINKLKEADADRDGKIDELRLKLKTATDSNAKFKARFDNANAAKAKLETTIAGLQAKLKASPEGTGNMAAITAELAALKLSSADKEKIASAQLAKLKEEVNALTKKLTLDARACDEAKKKLLGEINQLNGELDALKNGDKLKRAGDFPDLDLPMLVNDPLKLDARVRPLFINLRGINETAAEREATYRKITAEGNSSAADVVQFDSGSSEVTAAERKELETKLKSLGKEVKVLAVGYASTDGDAKSNYELSSKRASSVAQEIAKITGLGEGNIQAVYFGQTKRFDENNLTPNRIVEVWITR